MAVPSEDFRLISAAAVASSTIRVSFTAPPLALSASDPTDALSPRNYQVSGASAPVVTLATPVADDPLSIDLLLSAEMIAGGTYVLVVSGVKSAAGTALAGTNILSFAATISALPNGGAKASSIVDAIRSFLGTAFRGGSWDSLAYALAAGDEQVAQTARDVFEQLYLSTASGKYLDRLAGERGVIRPVGVGMSDDSFRRLAIALTTKVTHNALWEILEIFFGVEAVRGVLEAGVDEPYALETGDQLLLSFGDGVVYPITFEASSFTTISSASALEIVGAINERLRSLGSSAWAMPTLNPETNAYRVTLFSPGVGTGSSVEVVGGKAQGALRFPEVVDCALPIGTALSVAVPSLGTAEYTISGMTTAPLEAVREGDYVHLSAPALNALNQGSFRIESVEVEWTGASYSQRFTVTNTQAVVQTGPLLTTSDSDLIFWRRGSGTLPARRADVITADDNQVLIEVPATTAVVERSQESAAYLPPVDSFDGTFERRVDGDVLVDLTSAHGMSAGDWVYIGSAVSDMVIAPVTAGDVSTGGLPGTTSTSQRTIVDQIRSPDGIAARWGNTLTTMPNGKVLILGGLAGGGGGVSTASAVTLEITGTVTNPDGREALVYNYPNAADSPSPISYHAAVAVSGRIGDGVLRAGGKNAAGAAVSTISFYDQSLDAWSSISNAIHPACWGLLAIPVRDAGGDLVIILSGGQTAAATGTAVTSRVETSSGVATVVAGPTDTEVRALHAGCAIDSNTAMWCGGWNPTGAATAVRASTFVVGYDGTTYTSGPLSVARRDHKVIAIGNGRALAIGGYGRVLSRETANRAVHEVELFDLRTKTWIPCGRLRVPRVSPLVEMVGDRVYVAGGWSDYTAETIETSVEVLDLKTMKWGVVDGASLSLGIHNASCVVSGAIFSYGSQMGTDVGSNLAHMLLPGADRRSSPKGLTGLFKVKSTTTSSMVLESETGHYATGALSDLAPLSAREAWGGPYVWDNGGHAVSGVTALTQSPIPWHGRVAVLDLDDATSFPDSEGWVVFNFGKENEVGPVKYLGRVSDTAISLDFSFVFDKEVPANSDVTFLVNRGALDTTGLPNSFYITDSSSGRVAAESFIRQAVMAGPELNIRVKYPSDVGLGNAGRPAAGTAKITDAVRVWGSNDVDSDVVAAQGEEDV